RLGTRWIYSLRKDELINFALEFGFDGTGKVDEMRKRFAEVIKAGELSPNQKARLAELEVSFTTGGSTSGTQRSDGTDPDHRSVQLQVPGFFTPRGGSPVDNERAHTAEKGTDRYHGHDQNQAGETAHGSMYGRATVHVAVAEQVRKWGLKFNGHTDPLAFLEELEERATSYALPFSQLPRVMTETLTDRASRWFRTSQLQGATWTVFRREFLDFFLPPHYFRRLEDDIRARYQREGEGFKDYVIEIRTLMRHAGYDQAQELDRIYENSLPAYQMYVKRSDFETLSQLSQLAVEFESIQYRDRMRSQARDPSYRNPGRSLGGVRETLQSHAPLNPTQA
ncbi:hypothetical protein KR084_006473, partial [Drosophila pseudotakahashii]